MTLVWLLHNVVPGLKDVHIHFRYGAPLLLAHGFPQDSVSRNLGSPLSPQTDPATKSRSTAHIPRHRSRPRPQLHRHRRRPRRRSPIYHPERRRLNFRNRQLRPQRRPRIPKHNSNLPIRPRQRLWPDSSFDRPIPYPRQTRGIHRTPSWDLYQNWQLAFFSVPDAARYFIQGREREMLAWYFFHSSYSGNAAISTEHLDRYTREISKPGFLRSGFEYFAAATVGQDAAFFNATLRPQPLTQSVLVLGGESILAPVELSEQLWGPIGKNVEYDTIPKAGHWNVALVPLTTTMDEE